MKQFRTVMQVAAVGVLPLTYWCGADKSARFGVHGDTIACFWQDAFDHILLLDYV
jgi:hypothetical protein